MGKEGKDGGGEKKHRKKKEKSEKSEKKKTVVKVEREDGVVHAFSNEEKEGIVDHINLMMSYDDDYAPIDPTSMDIFERVMSGVLLCNLVNAVEAETIPARKINNKRKLNRFEINDNIDTALNGCRDLKLQIVNVGPEDIVGGSAYHLVLGVLWQLVRLDLLNNLERAKAAMSGMMGTDAGALDALVPEQVLLLWVNYHLERAGCERRMSNFSTDIKDSEIYTRLLHQLEASTFALSPLDESDLEKRAELLLQQAAKQKLNKFVNAKDIAGGNARLNFAFVATLFNHFQSTDTGGDSTDEEEEDSEELGAWKEDLEELENELMSKERLAAEADAKLAALKAQRDEARAAHQAEIDRLTAELEAMALAEPSSAAERELSEQLALEQKTKMALVAKQTDLLRKAADLSDQLDEHEDETRQLIESRQKAEADIREFKRKHKSDMSGLRRRIAQAKLEEEMLEHELEMQTEERDKLKEERSGLARKYKDLSIKLEVETIDRIQTQSAKDKLDRQLFHAKVVYEHKNALRSKNIRISLEQTVSSLRQQLDEDEEFHIAVRDETALKHEKETVFLAEKVVKDLGRKQQLLEITKQEADELEQHLKQTTEITNKLAESTHQIKREENVLQSQAAIAEQEKAAIDKKRRKLEKQLRKARRLIQDQKKEASQTEKSKELSRQKKLDAEKALERARIAAEAAERERRLAEMEVLDTNDHLNAVAMDKKRLAMEAQMLAEEAEELEEERVAVMLEKERVLSKLTAESRLEQQNASEVAKIAIESNELERQDAHADAVLATVALESERGERNRLQMDAEQFEKAYLQAEREAKAAAARAEREANEAKELRELAKAEKERAREERGLREEVEKEALSLEMQAIQAQKEAEQALDEKARLEARAALLSSQMDEARLASAQSKGEAQLAKEQLALEAEHALREAAQDERRRVKMEAEDLRAAGRAEALAVKAAAAREHAKLEQNTKTLEERLAQAEAELEAERRARKKLEAVENEEE